VNAPATLPNADRALLYIAKLRDYCLNPQHPDGRHKARVFKASLSLGRDDTEWLGSTLLAGVRAAALIGQETTSFGTRYAVDIVVETNGRRAIVRTGWIVRIGQDTPRFVTCFVL